MIYNNQYKIKFFIKSNGQIPVFEYIESLNEKEKAKVLKYIEFLRGHNGILNEPYSKHIKGKIRELRIDFSKNRHHIFYFIFISRNIILLHAFLKKTNKTPILEINRALTNYIEVINNQKMYE